MWKIEDFERVMPKARYSDKAHAIQGTLMHDTMIEAYEVYQHKNLVIPSADGLEINLPVILAKVNFGTHLNGHGGFVHGGIMSLMFDDIMGWGCDRVLPENKTPVTANLNVDFRRPVPAGTKVRIQVVLERWEGRKLFWKARMLDARNTEEEILYAEATSLYIVLKDK